MKISHEIKCFFIFIIIIIIIIFFFFFFFFLIYIHTYIISQIFPIAIY